ncbi:hypothetical protein LAZ67_1001308 [Cordylochernes scorpioides]|uniref:SPIN-DOC-like zinc-finger domain-containing protein n=1 Tax=Cordylochernes scorpioides TaxID=51811 RepID=A0ABY6JWW4_9ARAC|nr:hypothetical protein LAZ67_1001308 [Cordylochernes scorpioides]
MSSSKPSGSKTKRKIADEHRNFQEKWELEYFCSEVKDKIICLICNNAISVPKLYNIKRHYEQHKSKYDTYEAAEIVCPGSVKTFQAISLSRNTVVEIVTDMARNLNDQIKEKSSCFEAFSIACDESTEIGGVAQLAVFFRACDTDFNIFEELLELVPMHGTTTGEDIFNCVYDLLQKYNLPQSKLTSVATDGAPSMTGKTNGFVALLRKRLSEISDGSNIHYTHCIIHQEVLCTKVIKMENVLTPIKKFINFIRSRGLNQRQFSLFLTELESEYSGLSYYTEVRWISCSKVLKQFWDLKEEICQFLITKNQDITLFSDQVWLQDFSFMVDITKHLSDLNFKLQGKDQIITNMCDQVNAFKCKLVLWEKQLKNEDLMHFPTCNMYKSSLGETASYQKYAEKILSLRNEFETRFSDFKSLEGKFTLFSSIFSINIESVPNHMQMEVIDIQCDSDLKAKFIEVGVSEFYKYLPARFENTRKLAYEIMSMFGSTYRCEQLFTLMKGNKTPIRSRITDVHLGYHEEYEAKTMVLRGSATSITRLTSQRARRALDSARLQEYPVAELAARWIPTVDVPRSILWADLRRNCFSGHDADIALRLALHALHHPASRRANCVFASCDLPLDLQAWLFGVGLHPEAMKLTSVAKATIYKYHLGLEKRERAKMEEQARNTNETTEQSTPNKKRHWRNKPAIPTKRPRNLSPTRDIYGRNAAPRDLRRPANRSPTPGASCQPLNDTAENPTRHGNRAAMWPKPCDKFHTFDLTSSRHCSRQQATNNFPEVTSFYKLYMERLPRQQDDHQRPSLLTEQSSHNCREKVNDDQHTGRPRSLRCEENKLKIKELIKSNRIISNKDLSSETGLSVGLCHQIVTKDLEIIQTSSKFVLPILTEEQKEVRMDVCKNMVEMTRTDPEWMQKIITGDETWVYQYDPETKRQSSQWIERGEPKPKKARFTKFKDIACYIF